MATIYVTELDVLYRDLPSYQPECVGDLATAEETRVVLPSMLSMKLIAPPPESAGEMMVASMMPPVLATTSLKVITSPTSLTLIVEPALSGTATNPTSYVVGVLVLMKTPPRLPVIPRPSPTSVSATSSTVMTVRPVEGLSLGFTCSPGVIEAEKEFMAEMVDSFIRA